MLEYTSTRTNEFTVLVPALDFSIITCNLIFFSVSDTGIPGKRNSEFSQQESNLQVYDLRLLHVIF